jgi:ribosomal protein L32
MSVPAFRNAKAKVRRRRSHHALKPIQIRHDKDGNVTLPHRNLNAKAASAPKSVAVKAKAETKGNSAPVAKKSAPTMKTSTDNVVVKKVTRKAGRKK